MNAGLGETAYVVGYQAADITDNYLAILLALSTPLIYVVSHMVFCHSSLSVFQEARLQICGLLVIYGSWTF